MCHLAPSPRLRRAGHRVLHAVVWLTLAAGPATAVAQATASAVRLADEAIVVDTHIDAPSQLAKQWRDLGQATPATEFDYPRARDGGLDVAFMSIYTSADQDADGTARQAAHLQIDAVEALAARHPDRFALLRSPRDVAELRAGGRVLLALGMENGAPIGDDLSQLNGFHARGVRYLTLAHSRSNRISDSSYDANRPWQGLSPFGEQVVARMNRLGMMVDVSHLSDDAVRDVLRVSRAPVVATHSALRYFTPGFERNLSDELVRAIADRGGVVQVAFGTPFIDGKAARDIQAYFAAVAQLHRDNAVAAAGGRPQRSLQDFEQDWDAAHTAPITTLSQVLDHIDHAVSLVGTTHVGIGSDFDGVSGALPVGLKSVADYPNLVDGLRARGYDDEAIRAILGGNLLRVWTAVEAAATH